MDQLSRRAALASLAVIGLSGVACSDDPAEPSSGPTAADEPVITGATPETTTTSGPARGATPDPTASPDCVLTPEQTEGPFYLSDDLVRSDITEDRPGAALALTLFVVDADDCSPIEDAAVDIWHCDAEGVYSGFADGGEERSTFLRGTQSTGAAGDATFTTIYPGWYSGRAVHIHVKVHVGGDEVHTGQLYFDDDLTTKVYTTAEPYVERGGAEVRNRDDDLYRDGGLRSTLAVTDGENGHVATLTLGIRS